MARVDGCILLSYVVVCFEIDWFTGPDFVGFTEYRSWIKHLFLTTSRFREHFQDNQIVNHAFLWMFVLIYGVSVNCVSPNYSQSFFFNVLSNEFRSRTILVWLLFGIHRPNSPYNPIFNTLLVAVVSFLYIKISNTLKPKFKNILFKISLMKLTLDWKYLA